jgi:hypothetical protein
MVEDEFAVTLVRVDIEVIDPVSIEKRGAAFDAVHLIALGEQQLCQIRTVLTGYPGDKSFLHGASQLSLLW